MYSKISFTTRSKEPYSSMIKYILHMFKWHIILQNSLWTRMVHARFYLYTMQVMENRSQYVVGLTALVERHHSSEYPRMLTILERNLVLKTWKS